VLNDYEVIQELYCDARENDKNKIRNFIFQNQQIMHAEEKYPEANR